MKILKENFSEYDEYKKINRAIDIFNELKAINYKIISTSNIDLNSDIYNYTNTIFKNFTDEQKKILAELIEWSKNSDKNSECAKTLDATEKKELFNYIYWKREIDNENIFKNFNLNLLKKIFDQKLNESIFSDIGIRQICPVCKSEGMLFIRDINNKKGNYFFCKQCSHEIYSNEECKCKFCKKVKNDIYKSLKENLVELVNKIDNALIREFEVKNDITLLDNQMFEDYKLYRLNLDKDIREIFSYRPNDFESLKNIIDRIDKRNSLYPKSNYKKQIWEKLLERRIIYETKALEYYKYRINRISGDEELKHLKYNRFINTNCNIDKLKSLFLYDDLIEFKKHNTIMFVNNEIRLGSKSDNRFFCELNFKKGCEFVVETFNTEKYIINKYFFQYDNKLKINVVEKHVNNIFQSDAEKSMYLDLKNKYPDSIILINIKIKEILKISKVENQLNDSELEYLYSDASFNFVLCDLEGKAIKVVQVQRGIHHNEKKWIWRDSVKEKVSKLCGIEYEEVF
ncbi:DUF2726 domain-containing protein [Clostridium saudiense]|uniref:DUF2726 domain-containing protein n=1 Tax=Clostridium saudiense TaxID=1414720 RepID=UPI002673EAC4|nr:DUF2726 domain-containing protein [Clostridium saudiense]